MRAELFNGWYIVFPFIFLWNRYYILLFSSIYFLYLNTTLSFSDIVYMQQKCGRSYTSSSVSAITDRVFKTKNEIECCHLCLILDPCNSFIWNGFSHKCHIRSSSLNGIFTDQTVQTVGYVVEQYSEGIYFVFYTFRKNVGHSISLSCVITRTVDGLSLNMLSSCIDCLLFAKRSKEYLGWEQINNNPIGMVLNMQTGSTDDQN